METTELFYPEIEVSLGSYIFSHGIEIEVYSNQSSYFDWAKVRFARQFREKLSIEAKARASIRLGYDGIFDEVFEGYVTKPYNQASGMNEVLIKDSMTLLDETFISETFLNVSPQDILGYCLNKAGVTGVRLSSGHYPTRRRFVISKKNVIAVINEVNAAWGLSEHFFFSGGIFYWGAKPVQQKVYRFEYGINIISLNRSGGVWELETVSAPFIRHSHRIAVEHPYISGEYEVQRVVFATNSSGFIRTYIYF